MFQNDGFGYLVGIFFIFFMLNFLTIYFIQNVIDFFKK
jgi:hypothetical protein